MTDKEYEQYRELLTSSTYEHRAQLDKHILTLSSGFLAFSIMFIGDFGPGTLSMTINLPIIMWSGFVVSVIATISSFMTAIASHKQRLRELDSARAAGEKFEISNAKTGFAIATRWLNRVSYFGFMIGVVFLSIIAFLNLP